MRIDNKSLMILAVGVFVLSVMGTIFSINQLQVPSTTGYASSDSGTVNITIAQTLSIELTDDVINFGTCTLNDSRSIFVDSSQVEANVDNTYCDNATFFPDDLSLRNAGNVHACINMQTNGNGTTLFGTDGVSGIGYKIYNASASPGCNGLMQDTYLNFTNVGVDYSVCENLTAVADQDRINLSIGAWLSPNAKVGGQMGLTLNAVDAAGGSC